MWFGWMMVRAERALCVCVEVGCGHRESPVTGSEVSGRPELSLPLLTAS